MFFVFQRFYWDFVDRGRGGGSWIIPLAPLRAVESNGTS